VKETAAGCSTSRGVVLSFGLIPNARTLIELMHADLIAIRAGLANCNLQVHGIIDATIRTVGHRTTSKHLCDGDEWKQPFQKEYTDGRSARPSKTTRAATDVEQAIEKALVNRESARQPTAVETGKPLPAKKPRGIHGFQCQREVKERPGTPAAEAADPLCAGFENCMEQIWEQLIATASREDR